MRNTNGTVTMKTRYTFGTIDYSLRDMYRVVDCPYCGGQSIEWYGQPKMRHQCASGRVVVAPKTGDA